MTKVNFTFLWEDVDTSDGAKAKRTLCSTKIRNMNVNYGTACLYYLLPSTVLICSFLCQNYNIIFNTHFINHSLHHFYVCCTCLLHLISYFFFLSCFMKWVRLIYCFISIRNWSLSENNHVRMGVCDHCDRNANHGATHFLLTGIWQRSKISSNVMNFDKRMTWWRFIVIQAMILKSGVVGIP